MARVSYQIFLCEPLPSSRNWNPGGNSRIYRMYSVGSSATWKGGSMRAALLAAAVMVFAAGAADVSLRNATGGWDIHELYIVPVSSDQWGDDLLDGSVMTEGGVYSTELPPGLYSMRAVDEDGDAYEKSPALVTTDFVWEITLADLEGYTSTGSSG